MGDPPSSTVVHDAIQEKKAVLDAAGWRAAERVAAAQEHAQKAADSVVAEACSKADQRTAAADKMESQASAGLSAAQAESSKINEELLRAKQDVGELQVHCTQPAHLRAIPPIPIHSPPSLLPEFTSLHPCVVKAAILAC